MLSSEAAAGGGGGAYNLPGRLIIHKIVVENFKSYAGRQEIGPFDKVGRRGCDQLLIPAPVVYFNCGTQWVGQVQRH